MTHAIKGHQPGEIKTLKGLFFGPPKTGKTTLACSGEDVLLISFDPQGDMTKTLKGRKDITVVTPGTYQEIDALVRALYTTDAGRFAWVVVDSITFLFHMLGGKQIAKQFIDNKDVRRAYGRAGASVAQIISDLVRLPDTHVIFTAHLDKEYEEDNGVVTVDSSLGETEVKVAVTPMVWKILGPAVSFIGRTYKQNTWEVGADRKRNKVTSYRVSFNDGERSPAGSRLDHEGDYEVTPGLLQRLADEL